MFSNWIGELDLLFGIGELVLLVGMVGTEVNVGDGGTVILGETENCWI